MTYRVRCPNCGQHIYPMDLPLDKETCEELLKVLEHTFINHKYTRVHDLIRLLQAKSNEK